MVVRLDEGKDFGGTIIELTEDPASEVLKRYPDRTRIRFWLAKGALKVGDRIKPRPWAV